MGKKSKTNFDLLHKKFNSFTVISFVKRDKYSTERGLYDYWNCLCDCGKYIILPTPRLKKTLSCGCSRKRGYKEISGMYYQQIRHGAIKRKIEFLVDINYLWQLFIKQNRICPLTGKILKFAENIKLDYINQTASLDRINSSYGYIEGNLQWIYKICNKAKGVMSNEFFINWCKLISNNTFKTNYYTEKPIDYISIKKSENVSNRYIYSLMNAAKRRDISFNITKQDIWEKFERQHKKCYYSGIDLFFTSLYNERSKQNASIDRINNKIGYEKNNIQIVHKNINLMRLNLSSDDFLNMCKMVSSYNRS